MPMWNSLLVHLLIMVNKYILIFLTSTVYSFSGAHFVYVFNNVCSWNMIFRLRYVIRKKCISWGLEFLDMEHLHKFVNYLHMTMTSISMLSKYRKTVFGVGYIFYELIFVKSPLNLYEHYGNDLYWSLLWR